MQVRSLTKDLDLAGSDLMSVSHALRTDQSVALRTALRDSCFQYNLTVMKVLFTPLPYITHYKIIRFNSFVLHWEYTFTLNCIYEYVTV